jgi:peptidoglycan biosynthesis protein MviN/MurJ (putative lipid II flippase)
MSTVLVFASTFVSVFALGVQSLNVNQGHYFAAAVTSFFISTGHIWLYRVMPNPSLVDYVGYYLGGIAGITASMWFHRTVRAWWKARRERKVLFRNPRPRLNATDEHADVRLCGLHRQDDTN